MAYILDQQREQDCTGAFQAYRSYLTSAAGNFPPSAYALATSDWYFDPADHRCPHDSRLKTCTITERSPRKGLPPSIKIRLLSVREDGVHEFDYPQAYQFRLSYVGNQQGHKDWRYDEFRLNENNQVVHEIEWRGDEDTGSWLIEASDVIYTWIPKRKSS